MTQSSSPQGNSRQVIVDIIRGFALIGVLMANFAAYVYQQSPSLVLNSMSSPFDQALNTFNTIFFEWKFFTLFSILFGYSFGLLLDSAERNKLNTNAIFIRRMSWLFVVGCIHSLFWYGDVLHLYAICGMILLLFRKKGDRIIFYSSILCMFVLPFLIKYIFRNQPETFTDADLQELYDHLKMASLSELFRFNMDFYYRMFIVSGEDLRELTQVLGRFLFGYYLLRIQFFHRIQANKSLFRKISLYSFLIMIAYFLLRWLLLKQSIHINQFLLSPLLSIGILSTTTFYVMLLTKGYHTYDQNRIFVILQNLGKMTLTNYLLISLFLITWLYGIGWNQLGLFPLSTIWFCALLWLALEIIFSSLWLKRFRYGPIEWILRQFTYWKRISL
jgi:uncharacterized protein